MWRLYPNPKSKCRWISYDDVVGNAIWLLLLPTYIIFKQHMGSSGAHATFFHIMETLFLLFAFPCNMAHVGWGSYFINLSKKSQNIWCSINFFTKNKKIFHLIEIFYFSNIFLCKFWKKKNYYVSWILIVRKKNC